MYDLEEQEQMEALKAWWKDNARLVILIVAAAAATIVAIQGWRYYKATQSERASELYATLTKAVREHDVKQARDIAGKIVAGYGATGYGPMAALTLAKVDAEAGDAKSAETRLRWAMERSRDEELGAVARLQLAGVLLDGKTYDEALRLLDQKHPASFDALYADRRGDVLAAQGKGIEARAAYQAALDKLGANDPYRNVVQVKLDTVGSVR